MKIRRVTIWIVLALFSSVQMFSQDLPKNTVTLNDQTFIYDNIDWDKTRIKFEEDLRITLRQGDLPQIRFKFPDIVKTLETGQTSFEFPDVHRRGFSPITLNFIRKTEAKNEAITMRKGKLEANLNGDILYLIFEGIGGPALDSDISYPISGNLLIKVK